MEIIILAKSLFLWIEKIPCPYHPQHRECYREKPILTPCWICFFYFNLGFPLFLFPKRKPSIHNGLSWEPCPSAWMLNKNAFVQDPVHLWMPTGRTKLTHPSPPRPIPGEIFAKLKAFLLYFLTSSFSLFCKRTYHPDPIKWLFWDISLLSSWSASFLNKVIFFASTPSLRFIGLSFSQQREFGLGKKTRKKEFLAPFMGWGG